MGSIATLLVGSAVLVMALVAGATMWQLLAGLPKGRIRTDWYVLLAFIACFIVGYLYYLAHGRESYDEAPDLIAPAMFFMGAAFVALVARIMLRTTHDLLRVSVLESESNTDALTGMYNRRAFDRLWDAELARARRFDLPLSLLVVDIDHFKDINDSYGHAAGDQVLKVVGRLIGECLRKSDAAARYGGEEFAVIAPHTHPQAALTLGERMRMAIERDAHLALGQAGGGRRITVSVGVAGLDAAREAGDGVFARADGALYTAKRSGRNRVVIAVPRSSAAEAGSARAAAAS